MARARRNNRNGSLLELPVAFGGVSIGESTARLGVTINRANLDVGPADQALTCRRLTGQVKARRASTQADQGSLPGVDEWDAELDAIFDVKGLSVKSKAITIGLTFSLEDIDVATMARFAKREGQLIIQASNPIPEGEEGEDEE